MKNTNIIALSLLCSLALQPIATFAKSKKKEQERARIERRAQDQDKLNQKLLQAIISDDVSTVKTLLSNGSIANINVKFPDIDATFLISALCFGKETNVEIIELLLKAGIDVNAKDKNGYSALIFANNNLQIIKLLISWGADVNAKDNTGKTVLMHAAMRGREQMIRLLLAAGADVLPRSNEGLSAKDYVGGYTRSSEGLLVEDDAGKYIRYYLREAENMQLDYLQRLKQITYAETIRYPTI